MNNQDEFQVGGYYDGLSAVSRHIRMYFGQTLLAHGTCFFVMSDDGPVLVTNRHNFTGRNNITGELLHKEGAIPDHAVVTMHGPGEVHYHIDLVDHANPEVPAWTEHPTLGAKADCDDMFRPTRIGSDPQADWLKCLHNDLSAQSRVGPDGTNCPDEQ